MHVHHKVSICFAPTYTTENPTHTHTHTHNTQRLLSRTCAYTFPSGPTGLCTVADKNTYITFTFSWCFCLQRLTMRTSTHLWTRTKKHRRTHRLHKVGPTFPLMQFSVSQGGSSELTCQTYMCVCVCVRQSIFVWFMERQKVMQVENVCVWTGWKCCGRKRYTRIEWLDHLYFYSSYFGCFHATIYVTV